MLCIENNQTQSLIISINYEVFFLVVIFCEFQ